MSTLVKQNVTEQDVMNIIHQSIEESISNALVKPTDLQENYVKAEASLIAKPLFEFIKHHIENEKSQDDDTYTDLLVDKFYVYLNQAKESLQKSRKDKFVWLIMTFAVLAPFRQIQRDAEKMQNESLIFALNRLELDLLKMMNDSRQEKLQ